MTAEIQTQNLYIYPIKSCGGIKITFARLTGRGFQYDRCWALIDENDIVIDQIKYPLLASVKLQLASHALIAQTSNMEPLHIPFQLAQPANVVIKGYRNQFAAHRVGASADAWFSQVIHAPCRLVYMPDTSRRIVNPAYAINDDVVSFASAYPYHLMNLDSVAYVNTLFTNPVPIEHFRPNIVISGAPAFAEDQWQIIQINGILFHLVKPCDRCAITTVDQKNGKITGTEPLRTLAKFRTVDKKVLFGQYLLATQDGIVQSGDCVQIVKSHMSGVVV